MTPRIGLIDRKAVDKYRPDERPEERHALEKILQYLKAHGEQLDADIAKALKLPLERVRTELQGLSARGEVMTCHVTRFHGKRRIEGWACRVAGYTPPISPGRKPNPTKA